MTTCESPCSSRHRSQDSCRSWSSRAKSQPPRQSPRARCTPRRSPRAGSQQRTAANRRWTRPSQCPASWPPSSPWRTWPACATARSSCPCAGAGPVRCCAAPIAAHRPAPRASTSLCRHCDWDDDDASASANDLVSHLHRRHHRPHSKLGSLSGREWCRHDVCAVWAAVPPTPSAPAWCQSSGNASVLLPLCRSDNRWRPSPAAADRTIWSRRRPGSPDARWRCICRRASRRPAPPATTRWPGNWWRSSRSRRRQWGPPRASPSCAWDSWRGPWWPSSDPARWRTDSVWRPCWRARPVSAKCRTSRCRRTTCSRAPRTARRRASPPDPPGNRPQPGWWWSSWLPCAGNAPGWRPGWPASCQTRWQRRRERERPTDPRDRWAAPPETPRDPVHVSCCLVRCWSYSDAGPNHCCCSWSVEAQWSHWNSYRYPPRCCSCCRRAAGVSGWTLHRRAATPARALPFQRTLLQLPSPVPLPVEAALCYLQPWAWWPQRNLLQCPCSWHNAHFQLQFLYQLQLESWMSAAAKRTNEQHLHCRLQQKTRIMKVYCWKILILYPASYAIAAKGV